MKNAHVIEKLQSVYNCLLKLQTINSATITNIINDLVDPIHWNVDHISTIQIPDADSTQQVFIRAIIANSLCIPQSASINTKPTISEQTIDPFTFELITTNLPL